MDLDFGGLGAEECDDGQDVDMTIGELMEWRYLKAEREKEEVSTFSRLAETNKSNIMTTLCRETLHFGTAITMLL